MKKTNKTRQPNKLTALIMTIALLLSIAPTAFATETKTFDIPIWEGFPNNSVTISNLYDYTDFGDWIEASFVIDTNSVITFNMHLHSAYFVDTEDYPSINESDFVTLLNYQKHSFEGSFWADENGMENYITAGLSFKFNKPGTYTLHISAGYADDKEEEIIQTSGKVAWEYSNYLQFTVNDPATGSPAPVTPPTQAASNDGVPATPTTSKVIINGQTVEFEAYNIYDNNYFKLRDIAKALTGTEKQFEVTWNGEKNLIDLISNKAYTSVGGERALGDGTQKTGTLCKSAIMKDDIECDLTAYTINGNNFFKLRDLGKLFDFMVDWDGVNIIIDTSKSYTDENAETATAPKTEAFEKLKNYVIEHENISFNIDNFNGTPVENIIGNQAYEYTEVEYTVTLLLLYNTADDEIDVALQATDGSYLAYEIFTITGYENENYKATSLFAFEDGDQAVGKYTVIPENITMDNNKIVFEHFDLLNSDNVSILDQFTDEEIASDKEGLEKSVTPNSLALAILFFDTVLNDKVTGLTVKDFGFTNFVS